MKKILVNYVAASQGGALSVLKDFYFYVANDETCKKYQWIFVLSGDYLKPMPHIEILIFPEIKASWWQRLKFDFYKIKKIIKQVDADYILSLQNLIVWGIKQKQCVYIHQSIPFQIEKDFSLLKKEERLYAVYQKIIGKLIKKSAQNANLVAVQTMWMKNSVSRMSPCPYEKIVVVPFIPKQECFYFDKGNKWNEKMFFYPAFHSIYKNQDIIDQACMELEKRGINDIKVQLTTEKKYSSSLIENVGQLKHEEVIKKYQEKTLIFPSYIETVGLPLIEAAQQGTLILVADCEYAHETLGDYCNAYFFDPFNIEQLVELMQRVYMRDIVPKKSNYVRREEEGWKKMITMIMKEEK